MKHNIHPQLAGLAVPIGTLKSDPKNARMHTLRSVDQVARSLEAFSQYKPLIVRASDRVVIVGNGRLAAAKSLKWTHIAAIIVPDSNVDAVVRAISNNQTSDLSEFDWARLKELVPDLPRDHSATLATGFSADDLDLITMAPPPTTAVGGKKAEPPTHATVVIRSIPSQLRNKVVKVVQSVLGSPKYKDLDFEVF